MPRLISALCVVLALLLLPLSANAASGILKVTSFPTGAEVWVDGVNTGKLTPMSISLLEGDHTVKVQIPASGWTVDSRTVTIVPGNNDLSVTLLPSFDDERVARETADASLQAAIDAEATARSAADAALQAGIDAAAGQTAGVARLNSRNVYQDPGTMIPQVLGPIGTAPGVKEVLASNPLDFQTRIGSGATPLYRLQARDTDGGGTGAGKYPSELALLYSSTGADPAATGLSFNPNGTVTFAPGQSFPGTASAASLADERAERLSGDVATLAAANTYAQTTAANAATAYVDDVVAVERDERARADEERARLTGGNDFTGLQTVAGSVAIVGAGSGIRFPDGTIQTTAAPRFRRVWFVDAGLAPREGGLALLDTLAAVDAAGQPALVVLEPGTYELLDQRISVSVDLTMTGAGRERTVIRARTSSLNYPAIETRGDLTLRDLSLVVREISPSQLPEGVVSASAGIVVAETGRLNLNGVDISVGDQFGSGPACAITSTEDGRWIRIDDSTVTAFSRHDQVAAIRSRTFSFTDLEIDDSFILGSTIAILNEQGFSGSIRDSKISGGVAALSGVAAELTIFGTEVHGAIGLAGDSVLRCFGSFVLTEPAGELRRDCRSVVTGQ